MGQRERGRRSEVRGRKSEIGGQREDCRLRIEDFSIGSGLDVVDRSQVEECVLKYVMQTPRKRVGELTSSRWTFTVLVSQNGQ